MVSRSSAAAHVRLNQTCRRPTVYPHFFAHNLGYPLIHCFSNADGQRPTDSLNVLREDTHPHNVSRQWKQKDSHLKATICGRFVIPRKTKTAICGRPDRFQASKDPNQYPLDEIFLGRLPHITEIIFLKCQKLPHIGHFKLKTRHRHIPFSSDRRQHFENVIIIDDEAIDFAAAEFAQPFVGFRIGERTDVEMQRLVPSNHHLVSIHSLDRPVEMGKGTI